MASDEAIAAARRVYEDFQGIWSIDPCDDDDRACNECALAEALDAFATAAVAAEREACAEIAAAYGAAYLVHHADEIAHLIRERGGK